MEFMCKMREMQMMRPKTKQTKKQKKWSVPSIEKAKQKPILATVASIYLVYVNEHGNGNSKSRLGTLFM